MKRAAVLRSTGVISVVLALAMGATACGPMTGADAGDSGAEASVRDDAARDGDRDERAPDEGVVDEGAPDERLPDEGAPDAAARLVSLAIAPSTLRLGGAGGPTTATVVALGVYSDGTTRALEDDRGIEWTSSNPDAATVDAMGRVTAMPAGGEAAITARLGALSTTAPCTVSVAPRVLQSITIDPPATTLGVGATQRFIVTGTYSDGVAEDVTSRATFTSSGPALAFGAGADANLATGAANGAVTVTARVGALSATLDIRVGDNPLRSLVIEPGTVVLSAGSTQTLRAVGTYDDGVSREVTAGITWSSSNPASATVDAMGVVTAVAAAAAPVTITATLTPSSGAPVSATATVLVIEDRLMLSATLEPSGPLALGATAQIRVQGSFGDGMSRDLTAAPGVSFASSASSTATVSPGGLVRGVAGGAATITVTYMGQMATVPVSVIADGIARIVLTPGSPSALPFGATQVFTATAFLSNGTSRDLSDDPQLTFASSDPTVASVSNAPGGMRGTVTALARGTTTITATYTPPMGSGMPVVSAPVSVTVIDDRVERIVVTPRTATAHVGFATRFTVTAELTDGSTRDLTADPTITWSSSNETVATISNRGLSKGVATALARGTATVTATYVSGRPGAEPLTASASLTVSATTIQSVRVSPIEAVVVAGSTQHFTAVATFDDATTLDVTEDADWSLAPGYTGGTLSNAAGSRGSFTAGSSPSARAEGVIRARVRGFADEAAATVTVRAAPVAFAVVCSRVDPATGQSAPLAGARIVAGQRASCGAFAINADGTSSPASGATLSVSGSGAIDARGALTAGAAAGPLVVSATAGALTARAELAVVDGGAARLSIVARPGLPESGSRVRTAPGVQTQLVGVATYAYTVGGAAVTDAYEVTEQGMWSSSNPGAVEVSDMPGARGVAIGGESAGASTVTFALGAATSTLGVENTGYRIRSLRTSFVSLDGSYTHTAAVGDQTRVFVRGEFCPAGSPSGAPECGFWDLSRSVSIDVLQPAVAVLEASSAGPAVRSVGAGDTAVRATFRGVSADGLLSVVAR